MLSEPSLSYSEFLTLKSAGAMCAPRKMVYLLSYPARRCKVLYWAGALPKILHTFQAGNFYLVGISKNVV